MKSLIEYLNFLAARISFLGLYSKESVGDWSRKILIILEAVVKVMNQKILTYLSSKRDSDTTLHSLFQLTSSLFNILRI